MSLHCMIRATLIYTAAVSNTEQRTQRTHTHTPEGMDITHTSEGPEVRTSHTHKHTHTHTHTHILTDTLTVKYMAYTFQLTGQVWRFPGIV